MKQYLSKPSENSQSCPYWSRQIGPFAGPADQASPAGWKIVRLRRQVLDSMGYWARARYYIKAQTVRLTYTRGCITYIFPPIWLIHPGCGFGLRGSVVHGSVAKARFGQLIASQGVEAQNRWPMSISNWKWPWNRSSAQQGRSASGQIVDGQGADWRSHRPDAVWRPSKFPPRTGIGIDKVLEAIVKRSALTGQRQACRQSGMPHWKAMLVDSYIDAYSGALSCLCALSIWKAEKGPGKSSEWLGHRCFLWSGPSWAYSHQKARGLWRVGSLAEIGFLNSVHPRKFADTRVWRIRLRKKSADQLPKALVAFKPAQPVVFCGLFPIDAGDFLKTCGRRWVNCVWMMPVSPFEMENLGSIGFGFSLRFSWPVDLEIIQERLERESISDLIRNRAKVVYDADNWFDGNGKPIAQFRRFKPDCHEDWRNFVSPWISFATKIIDPDEYLGPYPEALAMIARNADGSVLCGAVVLWFNTICPLRGGVRFLMIGWKSISQGLRQLWLFRSPIIARRSGQNCFLFGQCRGPVDALAMLVHERSLNDAAGDMCGDTWKSWSPRQHVQNPHSSGHRRVKSSAPLRQLPLLAQRCYRQMLMAAMLTRGNGSLLEKQKAGLRKKCASSEKWIFLRMRSFAASRWATDTTLRISGQDPEITIFKPQNPQKICHLTLLLRCYCRSMRLIKLPSSVCAI